MKIVSKKRPRNVRVSKSDVRPNQSHCGQSRHCGHVRHCGQVRHCGHVA